MCLAIPGKIVEIKDNFALVDYGGEQREISLELLEAKVGDYVIANAGYAIRKLTREEAEESLRLFEKMR